MNSRTSKVCYNGIKLISSSPDSEAKIAISAANYIIAAHHIDSLNDNSKNLIFQLESEVENLTAELFLYTSSIKYPSDEISNHVIEQSLNLRLAKVDLLICKIKIEFDPCKEQTESLKAVLSDIKSNTQMPLIELDHLVNDISESYENACRTHKYQELNSNQIFLNDLLLYMRTLETPANTLPNVHQIPSLLPNAAVTSISSITAFILGAVLFHSRSPIVGCIKKVTSVTSNIFTMFAGYRKIRQAPETEESVELANGQQINGISL